VKDVHVSTQHRFTCHKCPLGPQMTMMMMKNDNDNENDDDDDEEE
jgi:hypothetical protein